jgi:hypothetical protein
MKKCFNILGHKGNGNHLGDSISPPSKWLPSITQTTNTGKNVREKEHCYTVGM